MGDSSPAVFLLDERQAAGRLCLAVRTLQKWRVTGGGPRFVKLGRSVRYRQSDLDQWVRERQRTSTSDTSDPGRAA